jgi:hypothetical protein
MDSTSWERTTTMRMTTMKEKSSHLLLSCLRRSSEKKTHVEIVPEQGAHVAYEVILADAEPEPPQPRFFNMIMRHYEESPPRMENGPQELDDLEDSDDLDDDPNEGRSDMDQWFPEDGSNDHD